LQHRQIFNKKWKEKKKINLYLFIKIKDLFEKIKIKIKDQSITHKEDKEPLE